MLLREGADTEVRTPSEYHLQIVHDESKQKSWEASGENSEGWDQRVAYRIGNLSNAEISDFFVYRRVYRIKPPISSISIFSNQ